MMLQLLTASSFFAKATLNEHVRIDHSQLNYPPTDARSFFNVDGRSGFCSSASETCSFRQQSLKSYSKMLSDCASKRSLVDGKAVHARLLRFSIEPDTHLWVSLLNFYSKCDRIFYAHKLFDEMPHRDVVAWTSLVSGHASEGNGRESMILFAKMQWEGVPSNAFALSAGLKACTLCCDVDFGRQLHGLAIKMQTLSDFFVGSGLVDLYAKSGKMELAERVFSLLPHRNSFTWNMLLHGYVCKGDDEKGLKLFLQIMESDIGITNYTLSAAIKCCSGLSDPRSGRMLHSLSVKVGLLMDGFLGSSLIDLYSNCGLIGDASAVFRRIEDPDVVSWTAIMSCFDHRGSATDALAIFNDMRRSGAKMNEFTFSAIASVASKISCQRICSSVHACILKNGFASENTVGNALIGMYMKVGAVQEGCIVFDELLHLDTVSWNSLLSGFYSGENCIEGVKIFIDMLIKNFEPNKFTFITIMRLCSCMKEARFGAQVHSRAIKDSHEGDSHVESALLDMYASCGEFDKACQIFKRMGQKDVFAWTVVITVYVKADQGEEAIKCYRQMQKERTSPNEFTLSSCLNACSNLASLSCGQQLHSHIIKSGFCGPCVSSSLVDMYQKCGCLESSEDAFDEGLPFRDIVSWNTMICGYSQHGYGRKSLSLLQSMLDEGFFPDEVTFVGVLSACSRAGLFDEGKKLFHELRYVYGITPTLKHYACMVDILGRSGKLDEVERFIGEEMNVAPDALIWHTVLSACRKHQNVEYGERAARELLRLSPELDSAYVLLANIYASQSRWGDVASIREKMSRNKVKKEPGCSWIEVRGQVHVFHSQASSYPVVKEISSELKKLTQEMKLAGYAPNIEDVLSNVSDVEKKESLFYHSERLALVYGLMNTSHRQVIRIYKNLRICVDCHNAMKIATTVTRREIVVRDAIRFHRFQDGSCSCQDCW